MAEKSGDSNEVVDPVDIGTMEFSEFAGEEVLRNLAKSAVRDQKKDRYKEGIGEY